jgi:hypothetical protein
MKRNPLSKERMRHLTGTVRSNAGRIEAEGGNYFTIFDFHVPFRLDFFQTPASSKAQFDPQKIHRAEFDLLVEIFRRASIRMPEAYHLDDVTISPLDDPAKIIGWHKVSNVTKYWTPGRDPDLFQIIMNEVLDEKRIK